MLNSNLSILEYTETFDQSDDKIWPDQQKEKHKNRDKDKFALQCQWPNCIYNSHYSNWSTSLNGESFEVESNMCWHVLTFNSWRNAGPHAWLFKRAAAQLQSRLWPQIAQHEVMCGKNSKLEYSSCTTAILWWSLYIFNTYISMGLNRDSAFLFSIH